jgi:cell division protein FtsZ
MGTGFAEGENRAKRAAEEALKSPLLDSNDINGTENILLNITSGEDEVRMGEIGDIIDYLQEAAGDNANIIWGNGYDAKLGKKISVTVIATGFEINPNRILRPEPVKETVVIPVNEPDNQMVNQDAFTQRNAVSQPEEVFSPIDLNPDESFTVRKEEQKREPARQEKISQLEKKRPRPNTTDKAEPISNWFTKQFGALFSEEDEELIK